MSAILDSIDSGTIALPEFQRGYVWGRTQVRELMRSLYRRYPVGGLLVWETKAETAPTRGGTPAAMVVKLLLDGQQRITTLYGIMRGNPPSYFQGDPKAFTDLWFHLEEEAFEFYGPVKMRGDRRWVDLSELYKAGMAPWLGRFGEMEIDTDTFSRYTDRLNRLLTIFDIDLAVADVPANLDQDEVVDIFNRVNTGGTKLSKGDLALARICAAWPNARKEMVARTDGWREHGFNFQLDWLLRVTTAVLTGQAMFTALRAVAPADFQDALSTAGETIDQLLNLVGGRLGLDHDRVLGGRYALPVLARYWATTSPSDRTDEVLGKLLYWYLHAALWGRHSGSTESVLNQDLAALAADGLDGLLGQLRRWRGDLTVRPEDLSGAERGSRFYPLIYLLTRVHGARDFGTGNQLSSHLLGKWARLELHHIFPNALLQQHGHDRASRNALANFCFLTQETNLAIGMHEPAEYLPEYETRHPGVLASQWIPNDPDLWRIERYPDFVATRRNLLADAANQFLNRLVAGAPEEQRPPSTEAAQALEVVDPDAARLAPLADEAVGLGLARPEIDHQIVDPDSGEVLAWADLAWPDGVRTGLTEPLAYLDGEDTELERRLGELGWRYYTTETGLRRYFETILGVDLDNDGIIGEPGETDDTLAPMGPPWSLQGGAGLSLRRARLQA